MSAEGFKARVIRLIAPGGKQLAQKDRGQLPDHIGSRIHKLTVFPIVRPLDLDDRLPELQTVAGGPPAG